MTTPTGTVVVREVDPEDAVRLGEVLAAAYLAGEVLEEHDEYLTAIKDVAARLPHGAAERARARGDEALVLSSMHAMPAAQRIYRRYGFERVPERDWLADWDPETLAEGTAETLSVYRLALVQG